MLRRRSPVPGFEYFSGDQGRGEVDLELFRAHGYLTGDRYTCLDQQCCQFIPPEFPFATDCASGEEKRCRVPVATQYRRRHARIAHVAVVERDGGGSLG